MSTDSFTSERLAVSARHTIAYDLAGPEDAPVVLFVHGGPGGGIRASDRALFEGLDVRVVFVDQRGSGRSRPLGETQDNDTAALIEDFEHLRSRLGIERWTLFGGSWGSTLALAYAIAWPGVVDALVIHGVFLCRARELRWFYQEGGAAELFPDEYERFVETLPPEDRGNVLDGYRRRLRHADVAVREAAARSWARWEAVNSYLAPDAATLERDCSAHTALPIAQIETHYFAHGAFFPVDDYLRRSAGELGAVPVYIVHGRQDTICPFRSAWDLHRAVPGSTLEVVPGAGHDSTEPALRGALRRTLRDALGGA